MAFMRLYNIGLYMPRYNDMYIYQIKSRHDGQLVEEVYHKTGNCRSP